MHQRKSSVVLQEISVTDGKLNYGILESIVRDIPHYPSILYLYR